MKSISRNCDLSAVGNYLGVFFDRAGTWFLSGRTLVEFCCNRSFENLDELTVGVVGLSISDIEDRCRSFEMPCIIRDDVLHTAMLGMPVAIEVYTPSRKGYLRCGDTEIHRNWLACDEDVAVEINRKRRCMGPAGMWRVPINQVDPQEYYLPYMVGTVIDAQKRGWFKDIRRLPVQWYINDVFMNEDRCKNGVELIEQLYECGRRAGIAQWMWPGYGTLLGAIRHGNFVPHDRDMDMVIMADDITAEQCHAYAEECRKMGLGEHRWRPPSTRDDNNKILWFSLGPKDPVQHNGIKCCQWFWFGHGDFWWHSKGGQWVSPNKFSPSKTQYSASDAAIAKGIPRECVSGFSTMEFRGVTINVPTTPGACLDHWYPGWPVPGDGASAHEHILVVGDWKNERTWRFS